MAAGCGRLFEGTPDQMWQTLARLMELPDATIVCSGHDYLDGNLRFAAHVDGANPAVAARIARVAEIRAAGGQPMPWTLAEEKASNPFLRAGDPDFKAARGMATASDAAHFADLRAMKDRF
jgi:hydroxyacylglutathione hydrolase